MRRLDSRDMTEEEKAFGIFEQNNEKLMLRNYITFFIHHIVYRNQNISLKRGDNIVIILKNKVSTIKLCEQKWRVDLNNNGLNWNKILNNVHNPIFNYKIQSSIWKMIHRNYICGYILKQMHKSDGVCKLCDKLEREHIYL